MDRVSIAHWSLIDRALGTSSLLVAARNARRIHRFIQRVLHRAFQRSLQRPFQCACRCALLRQRTAPHDPTLSSSRWRIVRLHAVLSAWPTHGKSVDASDTVMNIGAVIAVVVLRCLLRPTDSAPPSEPEAPQCQAARGDGRRNVPARIHGARDAPAMNEANVRDQETGGQGTRPARARRPRSIAWVFARTRSAAIGVKHGGQPVSR